MFFQQPPRAMAADANPPPAPERQDRQPPSAPSTAGLSASSSLSSRSVKQLGLFFAGAGFLLISTVVTRRAVARKQLAAMPKFYDHGQRPAATKPKANADGSMVALEALGLATLNVFSFMMMATGGTAWAFDVASIDDLRTKAKKTLYGADGKTDEAAEAEMEEWMAKVLSRASREKPGEPGKKADK